MRIKREYSDADYQELTEIYFKNEWIRKGTNFKGFEDLWFDYDSKRSKYILKELISNFKYIEQEKAKIDTKTILKNALKNWNTQPNDTLFIAFKLDDFSDGSSIVLNFIRPILKEINKAWGNNNLYGDLKSGLKAAKKKNNIKKVILIDDFVGTGSTAVKRINEVRKKFKSKKIDVEIYVFSLGGMEVGKRNINLIDIDYKCTYLIDKGSTISFPKPIREVVKKGIIEMEDLLYGHNNGESEYSLGYEKSEALYSWNVFNLPNNNYSVFWWNRYKNGKNRKTMFTRN
jgi:hypothetical protein